MPELGDYLLSTLGAGTVLGLPDLASDVLDIFTFVDLQQWISSGGVQPPVGTGFSFTNGTSALLPGVQVSLTEFTFDPSQGMVNHNPFTGDAYQAGRFELSSPIPEPRMVIPLALGFVCMCAYKLSRQRNAFRSSKVIY